MADYTHAMETLFKQAEAGNEAAVEDLLKIIQIRGDHSFGGDRVAEILFKCFIDPKTSKSLKSKILSIKDIIIASHEYTEWKEATYEQDENGKYWQTSSAGEVSKTIYFTWMEYIVEHHKVELHKIRKSMHPDIQIIERADTGDFDAVFRLIEIYQSNPERLSPFIKEGSGDFAQILAKTFLRGDANKELKARIWELAHEPIYYQYSTDGKNVVTYNLIQFIDNFFPTQLKQISKRI